MDDLHPAKGELAWEEVHGRCDFQFPQLEMVRPDLEGVPELRLPPGYSLRHYREGDDRAWAGIMTEAFNSYWGLERFHRLILPHFGFRPERIILLCHDREPVGSASAFHWPGMPRGCGYIHMVGVKKRHCGKGLGYWLAAACLRRFREEGLSAAVLQTEDYRLPAIKHYLRLGFQPALINEEQRDKWSSVLTRIGGHERTLAELPELPVMNPARFWWRSTLVVNYLSWLNFKADLKKWTQRIRPRPG